MDLKIFFESKVPLFAGIPGEILDEILKKGILTSFEAHEAVIEFREKPQFLGILLKGEAELAVRDNKGEKHQIEVLKEGDMFGEVSLMTGEYTISDVIGISRCKAFLIPHELFSTKLAIHPGAVRILSQRITSLTGRLAMDPVYQSIRASSISGPRADLHNLALKSSDDKSILVLTSGEDWLQYKLFGKSDEAGQLWGIIEHIGSSQAVHTCHKGKESLTRNLSRNTHEEALKDMIALLSDIDDTFSTSNIGSVGHRVVHGGKLFTYSVMINDQVLEELAPLSELAPLHNPYNLKVIREGRKLLPGAKHVAVFDTAFHHTLPSYAYLYGLPNEYYEKYGIRRYGFHGMSHLYAALKGSEFIGKPFSSQEIVTCHLGRGTSLCAIDHGRSVDTSMGFTPLEGVMMQTRCGNVDPGALFYLMKKEGFSPAQMEELTNRKSGVRGISGINKSFSYIEKEAEEHTNDHAVWAVKSYAYQIKKYIGSYMAAMGGLDILIFTGSTGTESPLIRGLACQGLECMGVELDRKANQSNTFVNGVRQISADHSGVKVLVVQNEEERMIARETLKILDQRHVTKILDSREAMQIPLEVSAHHVHLARKDVEVLFGKDHKLCVRADLSQPGQFACEECVTLEGPRGKIERVRVLGPERDETQIEIAKTEQFKLGIQPPIRQSGDLDGTPGVTIIGPAGSVTVNKGVICAMRHIHMTPEDALRFGLKDKDIVRIKVGGDRELIFGDVIIRVKSSYRLAMHLDTDEANAANIKNGMPGTIDSIQSRGEF